MQRRNADCLPGRQPVLAVGALAVHAQLALPHDTLDVRVAETRKPRLEKAVDAHVGFVRRHRDGLHLGRQWRAFSDLPRRFCDIRPPQTWRRGSAQTNERLAARLLAKSRLTLGPFATRRLGIRARTAR